MYNLKLDNEEVFIINELMNNKIHELHKNKLNDSLKEQLNDMMNNIQKQCKEQE